MPLKNVFVRQRNQFRKMFLNGLTMIELLLIVGLLGLLLAIAIPSYSRYQENIRIARAISDIRTLSFHIVNYKLDHNVFPPTLADVSGGTLPDPWGNPYQYTDLTTTNGNGKSRRDKNLNPLNSDFDLYSLGKDGATKMPIHQKESLDDVLRANDGTFVDLASKY
jgi:general secretion pathway protein G